jgi:ABC-type amino acid transport substrate-binding protein
VLAVKEGVDALAALEDGKADAYAGDKLLLVGTQPTRGVELVMLPDDLSVEPYGIVLPRGDWPLRLAVNTGLADIYRSGQIAEIFKRWFDQVGLQQGPLLKAVYTLGSLSN